MIAALVGLVMCVAWIAFVVLAVIGVTSMEARYLAGLVMIAPVVLLIERYGFKALDHLTDLG